MHNIDHVIGLIAIRLDSWVAKAGVGGGGSLNPIQYVVVCKSPIPAPKEVPDIFKMPAPRQNTDRKQKTAFIS